MCRAIWDGYSLRKVACEHKNCPIFAVVKDGSRAPLPKCRAHGRGREHCVVEVLRALRAALQACGHADNTCILQQLPVQTRGPQERIRSGNAAKVDLGVLHLQRGLLGIEVHGRGEHIAAKTSRKQPRTEYGEKAKQKAVTRDRRKRTAWSKLHKSSGGLHEISSAVVLGQSKSEWADDMTQALQARVSQYLDAAAC